MNTAQAAATILCIEDEPDLLRDIADELREAGYHALAAGDGLTGLKLLKDHQVQLVLCDISMPGMDGFAVLAKARQQQLLPAATPFVFLSAANSPQDVVTGKRLGADDYLVKPIDYDMLLATIDARLRQVERMCEQSQPPPSLTSGLGVLAERFGLTPAELRVLSALGNGQSLKAIAKEQGVARSTIAFHVRNLFGKTGTSRQAELVALIFQA